MSDTVGRKPLSKKRRFRILQRYGFRCRYCGRPSPEVRLEIEHVVPISRGGTDAESNLVAACFDCNRGKSTIVVRLPGVQFLPWLLAQAERDDWVGDLARDEIKFPSLREPVDFRDLTSQIRAEGGDRDVARAAWHAWREYSRRGGRPTLRMQRMQERTSPIDLTQATPSEGARIVCIADVQLRQWATDTKVPVWESLYSWLVSLGLSETDKRDLHNRTYCGEALMARLREAERARLRALKLRGARLQSALSWSDMGSGPMESWHGKKLLGDALFVLHNRDAGDS
jgi:hypothetical protein